jgi:SAM-dependent methyltransferase
MTWSAGCYEHIATGLLPAVEEVVERASPSAGERVLDLGCGTGSAALAVARRGVQRVMAVDPAERLLDVGRAAAAREGLDVQFAPGAAEAIPAADGSVDVLVSVFGVIFASDPARAIAELQRVTAARGRIVLSAWLPEGPLFEVAGLRRRAVSSGAPPAPSGPPPFAWHEGTALRDAFGEGFSIDVEPWTLAFRSPSVTDFVDGDMRDHPLWAAARARCSEDEWRALREEVIAILTKGSRDEHACHIESSYVIATVLRTTRRDRLYA